jgi:hypothetical protein
MRDVMEVIRYVLLLLRRKVFFLMAVAAVVLVGFLVSDEWSWPAVILLIVLLSAVILFWALITFWLSVFRTAKRPES